MKSCRVTPKSKNRDSERRKTCIVLLSPTHRDYTELDQSSFFESQQSSAAAAAESLSLTGSPGQTGALGVKASTDSDEESSKSGSVKVYKFMGEELTVEEGLVRKQTQGRNSSVVTSYVSNIFISCFGLIHSFNGLLVKKSMVISCDLWCQFIIRINR